MESWTSAEVQQFLLKMKISQRTTSTLFEAGISGVHLNNFNNNDYTDIGIPLADALIIPKLRDKYLKGGGSSQNEERQNPRRFGEPVGSKIKYKKGSILPCENSNYSLDEPLREFKEFSLDTPMSLEDEENAFISKLGKFANACINSRKNGTIYFGVCDSRGKHKHGEIKGVNTSLSSTSKYEDWIEKHFRKNPKSLKCCRRDEQTAFSTCISMLHVIEIENYDRVILEIDVEPKSSVCKFLKFKINTKQYPNGVYFKREGTSSIPLVPNSKEEKLFINSTSTKWAGDRMTLESYKQPPSNIPQVLNKLLCKGEHKILDGVGEYNYFLVTNRFCEEECCKMTDSSAFEWVKLINWRIIFDFDKRTRETGILSNFHRKQNALMQPNCLSLDELQNLMQKDNHGPHLMMKDLEYGNQTVHVSCAGSVKDSEQSDFLQWRSQYSSQLKSLFEIATGPSYLASEKQMIFVICACSDEESKKFKYFLKSICIKPKLLKEFTFLSQSENHLKLVRETILEEYESDDESKLSGFIENSLCVSWAEVSAFVEKSQNIPTGKKFVRTSKKLDIELKPAVLKKFQRDGLSILASNECEDLKTKGSEEITKLCNKTMVSFLQGQGASWELFAFAENMNTFALKEAIPCALINREIVPKIQSIITKTLSDTERCIVPISIGHLPGTGATTALMQVLWKQRSEHRCLMVNGRILDDVNIDQLAADILAFRSFGEEEAVIKGNDKLYTCLPLLIFLDNSDKESAEKLQRKILDEIDHRGIKFETAVGVLLYVCTGKSKDALALNVKEHFSPEEKLLFKSKLHQFEKCIETEDINPTDMLGFLTFMNRDLPDIYQDYIAGVTKEIICKIDGAYPAELKLLKYLAVFKCFNQTGNISVSHAKMVLGYGISNLEIDFLQYTCEYFKMIVRTETEYEQGYGHYSVIEISHLPVAEAILNHFLDKESLLDIMLEILNNKPLVKQRFLQSKFIDDLSEMAVKRRLKSFDSDSQKEKRKDPFSSLILRIKDIKKQDAISLLEHFVLVFEEICNGHVVKCIANLNQTLSRLHLDYIEFEEAKKFARKAVNLNENCSGYHDTVGQIYKREIAFDLDVNSEVKMESNKILELALEAVNSFIKAQDRAKQHKSPVYQAETDSKEINDDDIFPVQYTGYVGEIQTIHTVAEELLKRVPSSLKTNFKEFITGKDVGLHPTTVKETCIDVAKFGKFMQIFFQRSQFCISSILKYTDSKRIQDTPIIDILRKWCKKQCELFVENDFSGLPAYLQKSKPSQTLKMRALRKYCDLNMVGFLYYVKEMNFMDINLMREIFTEALKLTENNKSFLDSYTSLCILNANFPSLAQAHCQQPVLPFIKACKLSYELASITTDELLQYETFFWYMVLHWPTQKELEEGKQCRTYDELKLLSCIQKLKKIQEEGAYVKKRNQRQYMQHSSIFTLRNKIGFEKLASNIGRADYPLARLPGKIKDRSNLEYVLPGKNTVTIRAATLRYNRGSSAQNVKFTLGFSLAGPIAYFIEKSSDEIQLYNDFEEEQ